MIRGTVEKPIPGMENIMICRGILASDEQLLESSEQIDAVIRELKQDLIDRDVVITSDMINREIEENANEIGSVKRTGSPIGFDNILDLDLDNYDTFSQYIQNTSSILGTKKLLSLLGIQLPSNMSTYGMLKVNKVVQSIMGGVFYKLLANLHSALETGSINDSYDICFEYVKRDLMELPQWKYDLVQDKFDSYESYEMTIESEVEKILARLHKAKYAMGILLSYKGIETAKEEIKEAFHSIDITELDAIIDILEPEHLISESGQFHQILSSAIQSNPRLQEIVAERGATIDPKLSAILTKLAEDNAFSKFNQGNNMLANIYPTLIIQELIATIVTDISGKLFSVNSVEELDDFDRILLDMIEVETFEKLSGLEVELGIKVQDTHVALLSLVAHAVSPIVANQRSLRSVDGRFQQFVSSIAQSTTPFINDLIEELKQQLMKMQEQEEGAEA